MRQLFFLFSILITMMAAVLLEGWSGTGFPLASALLLACSALYRRSGKVSFAVLGPFSRGAVLVLLLALAVLAGLACYLPVLPSGRIPDSTIGVLLLITLVPLAEEFYFRGIFQHVLERLFSPLHAVVLGSVLFGLLHMTAGSFATAAVLGLVCGYATWRTRQLGPAVLIHACWNALAVIWFAADMTIRSQVWAGLAGVLLLVLLFSGTFNANRHESTPQGAAADTV